MTRCLAAHGVLIHTWFLSRVLHVTRTYTHLAVRVLIPVLSRGRYRVCIRLVVLQRRVAIIYLVSLENDMILIRTVCIIEQFSFYIVEPQFVID